MTIKVQCGLFSGHLCVEHKGARGGGGGQLVQHV